jgi:hypothetical protein
MVVGGGETKEENYWRMCSMLRRQCAVQEEGRMDAM